jgi:hypothetical protein
MRETPPAQKLFTQPQQTHQGAAAVCSEYQQQQYAAAAWLETLAVLRATKS